MAWRKVWGRIPELYDSLNMFNKRGDNLSENFL